MENQQKPTNKIALNYGLILGFAGILQGLVFYAMGKTYDNDWYKSVISIVIMAVIIFLGIKEYRKNNSGLLSLGQGIKTGLGIVLIGTVISVIYTLIFANFIEPGFIDNVVELQEKQFLENPNMTDEMIEKMSENTRKYFWHFTIGFIFIFSLFLGFIVSLISSLIMKKTDEEVSSI